MLKVTKDNTTTATHSARDFGCVDSKGRTIGARVAVFEFDFVEAAPGGSYWNYARVGHVFAFVPQALRAGKDFGAYAGERWFDTAEARDAAIEKYFADAAKRAAKQAGGAK